MEWYLDPTRRKILLQVALEICFPIERDGNFLFASLQIYPAVLQSDIWTGEWDELSCKHVTALQPLLFGQVYINNEQ